MGLHLFDQFWICAFSEPITVSRRVECFDGVLLLSHGGGGEEKMWFVCSTTKTTRLGEEVSGPSGENLHAISR